MIHTAYRKGQSKQEQLFGNELKSTERNGTVLAGRRIRSDEVFNYGQNGPREQIDGYEVIR